MDEEEKPHPIRDLIYLVVSIANLVFIIRIFIDTKEDTFKLEEFNDRYEYFNSDNFQLSSFITKQCKCGQEIVNDFCSEEQILSGCIDYSLTEKMNREKFLRFLMEEDKCKHIENEIMVNNKTLSQIFNTNINYIHKMALGIMVVISLCIFSLLAVLLTKDFPFFKCFEITCAPFAPIIICTLAFSGIVNLVLYIILIVKYYKGDTRNFVSFLDCQNVNNDAFSKYHNFEILKLDFFVFMIINIFDLIMNFLFMNCKFSYQKNENNELNNI